MSDVHILPGISGLSFDSPFLSPFLFFCLVLLLFVACHFSGNGPFSRLWGENPPPFLIKRWAFLYGSCQQLHDSW